MQQEKGKAQDKAKAKGNRKERATQRSVPKEANVQRRPKKRERAANTRATRREERTGGRAKATGRVEEKMLGRCGKMGRSNRERKYVYIGPKPERQQEWEIRPPRRNEPCPLRPVEASEEILLGFGPFRDWSYGWLLMENPNYAAYICTERNGGNAQRQFTGRGELKEYIVGKAMASSSPS